MANVNQALHLQNAVPFILYFIETLQALCFSSFLCFSTTPLLEHGTFTVISCLSVQFNRSVVSDSLWPQESQHARLPVHYQLPEFSQTHVHRVSDAIQPSHPLSSPSLPAPNPSQHQGFFPVSQLFAWPGESIGVSAPASVLPMNTKDWSLGWTGWISLQSKGLSKHLLQHQSSKAAILWCSVFFKSNSHIYIWPLKNHSLD